MLTIKNGLMVVACLFLFAFTACEKEDLDLTETQEEMEATEMIDCSGFSVELSAEEGAVSTEVTGGIAPYTFSWTDGSSDAFFSATEDGLYEVLITDSQGCITSESIEVTLPVACSNELAFTASALELAFTASAEGHFWDGGCDVDFFTFSNTHNYMVIDADWNSTFPVGGAANPAWIVDGLPAIFFGNDGIPESGTVLDAIIFDRVFDESSNHSVRDLKVTIDSASDTQGGELSGTITATVYADGASSSEVLDTVTGSFCVSLTEVCN